MRLSEAVNALNSLLYVCQCLHKYLIDQINVNELTLQ